MFDKPVEVVSERDTVKGTVNVNDVPVIINELVVSK